MSCVTPKDALRAFLAEVIGGEPSLDQVRGVALFDVERDSTIRAVNSFSTAAIAVGGLPHFAERFGTHASERIVLQFVYQYFRRVAAVRFDDQQFEKLWDDLVAEVQNAVWTSRGVANLRCFQSDLNQIDLGDGVTIRGRSQSDLATLGFDESVWQRISEDWSTPIASSFVLVAEHSFPKQPDNLILGDSYNPSVKAMRAIQAMRLAGAGSVDVGPMWFGRSARFNVGFSGTTSSGSAVPKYGATFAWTDEVQRLYGPLYDSLVRLEKDGYGRSPGNLAIALRSFAAAYDRWPTFSDSQLLDLITSLEALLGTESEIAFRLSFRVASLIAKDGPQRSELLKKIRGFYDTRSRIVHGGTLGKRHQDLLQRLEELQAIARRLLRSFVEFAAEPKEGYGKPFWQEQLDAALVDSNEREKLRAVLRL